MGQRGTAVNTTRHVFSAQANPTKARTRDKTLHLVQDETWFWYDGVLTADWIELCAERDETLQLLLREGALQPGKGRYVGVNKDAALLARNRDHFAEATAAGLVEWVEGTWEDVLSDLSAYPNAGILVFDSFNSVANEHLAEILEPTIQFAHARQATLGQALVVLNLALRGKDRRHDYHQLIEQRLGVPVSSSQFNTYRGEGRTVSMHICWVKFGA